MHGARVMSCSVLSCSQQLYLCNVLGSCPNQTVSTTHKPIQAKNQDSFRQYPFLSAVASSTNARKLPPMAKLGVSLDRCEAMQRVAILASRCQNSHLRSRVCG